MRSPSVGSLSLMASKVVAARQSPESKPESPRIPPVQQKKVLLFEWWLIKAEKGYNGRRLAVGGFTKRGEAVGIFKSAPIIKRHDQCTLGTADGITLRIQGSINKTRTIDNGLPLEVCNAFLFGFPSSWDIFFEESSGSNPSDWRMLEHQLETRFDPSSQQKTVLLRNWWLMKAEKGFDGNRLAVGGFTEWGKAMRIFDSSPIIKRHDAYTLETADGITVKIEGFINKKRTLCNGFPFEACKTFLIGFPTTWTDYANDSSRDKSSHVEIPLASRGAECCKDSPENVPFGFPVKSKNIIPDNVSSTSNTSAGASDTRLREAIKKFATWVSTSSPVHMPFVDRSSHHLPERSICDNNQLQNDESCGANMRDAHTNNQFQDGETHGTNLKDAHTGYNYCETGHTPVDNASENRETSCTEGLHPEGAGCPTVDSHLDGLPQEKCNGHVVTKGHHDKGVGSCSTSNLWDSVAGKGHQKEEIAQEKDEKFDECSTRRPKKVRSGLSNVENLHGEDQKYAKFTSKPVRRSLRLMPSNNLEDVHGEFQDRPQFLKGTNDMNCANLILDRSKTCTSQPIDTLVKGEFSSPNHYVEAHKCAKSFSKPVINMNHATLSSDGSKTNARSQPNYTMLKGSPMSPASNILVPSAGVLSEENQDGRKHSLHTRLGLVDETPANSKAVTSQTIGKKMLRCTGRKKDNQTVRSRTKAEQNGSRNLSSGTSFEENILVSSASLSRRKAIPLTPISDKSSTMRKNSVVAKHIDASTETQQTKDKASHTIGYKTVWVSSYTDGYCTPLTRYEKNKSSILMPESLNLKRSRSGRLLIPRLDCSMRVMYEPDGSFAGTATVDGSCAGNATVVMSTSQRKGSRKMLNRKKRKKQR